RGCTRVKLGKQRLRRERISARVKCGAAQCFHADEHGRIRLENLQRVVSQIFRVVVFRTAQVPAITGERQGFGLPNFKCMADQWWSRQRKPCKTESNDHEN